MVTVAARDAVNKYEFTVHLQAYAGVTQVTSNDFIEIADAKGQSSISKRM